MPAPTGIKFRYETNVDATTMASRVESLERNKTFPMLEWRLNLFQITANKQSTKLPQDIPCTAFAGLNLMVQSRLIVMVKLALKW